MRSRTVKVRLIERTLALICAGFLLIPASFGQASAGASRSRPGSHGASTRLGRTGGFNTGRYEDTIRNTPRSGTQAALQNGGNLGQQNFFGAARGIGGIGPAPLPQAFSILSTGMSTRVFSYPVDPHLIPPGQGTIAHASGLSRTLARGVSLFGAAPQRISAAPPAYFLHQPRETAFARFFELNPYEPKAEPAPRPAFGAEPLTWARMIEQENELFTDGFRHRALKEFALATSPDVENAGEVLSRAQTSLQSLALLDSEDYVPTLLLLHVAFAKQQPLAAFQQLHQLVRRKPDFFVERPDVARFFGDYALPTGVDEAATEGEGPAVRGVSRMLQDQAHGIIRVNIDDQDARSAGLQAYCAWVLNDKKRMRRALARIDPSETVGEERQVLKHIRYAMEAALR